MTKPRLLDLFCGAGGCTKGYQRAGFHVVGVDISPQPNYCGDEFVQDDALALLATFPWWDEPPFDAIHASPPCQAHTSLNVMWNAREREDLVGETRLLLEATGLPYVIENVVGAPLIDAVTVCGASLGLGADGRDLARHRIFECSFPVLVPPCAHRSRGVIGIYGDHARRNRRHGHQSQYNVTESLKYGSEAMGIDWMTWPELAQAIPPLYTELIGRQLLSHLKIEAAA